MKYLIRIIIAFLLAMIVFYIPSEIIKTSIQLVIAIYIVIQLYFLANIAQEYKSKIIEGGKDDNNK